MTLDSVHCEAALVCKLNVLMFVLNNGVCGIKEKINK
jgi:hypothetical protein